MEKTGSLLVSKILCVFLCLTFVFSAYAQDSATKEKEEKRVIKGRVLDEKSGTDDRGSGLDKRYDSWGYHGC